MNPNELLQSLGERFATSATVKAVYGDPVSVGDRTIIPVASVRFGFGGGGGGGQQQAGNSGEGGGGAGGLVAKPAGVVEITPTGTRFIRFPNYRRVCGAITAGFFLGLIVARLRSRPHADFRASS